MKRRSLNLYGSDFFSIKNRKKEKIPIFPFSCPFFCDTLNYNMKPLSMRIKAALPANSGGADRRTERMRMPMSDRTIGDQLLLEGLDVAFAERQFVVYFQPQYNHANGTLIGAEALARWIHPDLGLLSPAAFVPTMEENRTIPRLDRFVFEKICRFQRQRIADGDRLVPISMNVSKADLREEGFLAQLEEIRRKYDLPTKYIRIEITESFTACAEEQVCAAVKQLHELGYLVEMDDFGSGLSSLNVLKDIAFDVIKLDMRFLAGTIGGRGGVILSSVIRMAQWLGTPVIAEGVETREQADYMRSIGCSFVQGFLYARPMPEEAFLQRLRTETTGALQPQSEFVETLDAQRFWNPESLETLIFNQYVGGAAIFLYRQETVEVLRVNTKYLKEMGMNMSESEVIRMDAWAPFDEGNKKIYIDMIQRAIKSGDEEECETWRTFVSPCCGTEKMCIQASVRMIGRIDEQYLFYSLVRNITRERKQYAQVAESERRFRAASEQVNIYAWEYTVATREMRPCFRCMRDLGLPSLLKNYPDSAIEMGIFPPDYADMYRDWHRQIEQGVPYLEAIIPLTVGRVPFHVRYTTEFDELGRPVKAYGSAALVVDPVEKEPKGS